MTDTKDYILKLQQRASTTLQTCLENPALADRLEKAIHYAVNNGGKRIRPVLAYASAEAVGGSLDDADNCACAVELIHTYSLIHDDLPAMDDDELRRGSPTCHIMFDEATAILAGDALQSMAFELLANSKEGAAGPEVALQMVATLAEAAGWRGMVAGQAIDIEGAGIKMSEETLAKMHGLKTGVLINASVRLGAMSSGSATVEQLANLQRFATSIGLAFQVKDDILDVEGDTTTLGKQQGKDQSQDKATYPAILGLEGAKQRLVSLLDEALAALEPFGEHGEKLAGIARYIIEREN